MTRSLLVSLLALGAGASGSPGPPPPADVVELRLPAGSVTPHLAPGAGGRTILTWLEPVSAERHALRFAVREAAGRWSAPGTIRESDRFFVNWADFPSLAETAQGHWVAHWLEKTAAKPYAYHVMVSVSTDRGASWGEPFPAHRDRSDTEHGFVSMSPRPGGGVDLVWLDGRRMGDPVPGPMGVRTTTLDPSARLGEEIELDDRTCECCQTAVVRTSRGLVVAYRDRSPTEIRDIAVVRQLGDRWSAPAIPAPDRWEHRACPVNGPALAADGDRVALAWYTGVGDRPKVYLIRSAYAGATFGRRLAIDAGQPLGRVHLAALADGAVAVVWLEALGGAEAEWRVSRVDARNRVTETRTLARVSRARLAGFPRISTVGNDLLVAYTGTGDDAGVRVVRTGFTR